VFAGHPGRVLALLAAYFFLQVAIRVWAGLPLEKDEAEQVFFSQWFCAGYGKQPPLYTWLQRVVFFITGPSVLGLAVLKNSLLLGTYVSVFAAARRTLSDPWLVAAAPLATFLVPQIAWESQRDLTHSVAATFSVSVLLYAVVVTSQTRRPIAYAVVGLATGMAVLSKYNTVIPIAAILMAALACRPYRDVVRSRKILIAMAVATVVIAPHAVWLIDHWQASVGRTAQKLMTDVPVEHWARVRTGVVAVLSGWMSVVALPSVVVALACGGELFGVMSERTPITRFLTWVFWIGLALIVAMVVAGYGARFRARWLQPLLFCYPLYLLLKLDAFGGDRRTAATRVAWVGLLAMAAVPTMMVLRERGSNDVQDSRCPPYEISTFNDGLCVSGRDRSRFMIAKSAVDAGVLRIELQGAPVHSIAHPWLSEGRGDGGYASRSLRP